ncbi:MAG: hypothetical protein Q4G51_05425 [Dermatophilus congolensis]|nr:hypothetical protein [Dermatophilus congolensis]
MRRLVDLTLASFYATVGFGDMLADRSARREVLSSAHEQLDNVASRGRNLTFDAITGLPVIGAAIGARLEHERSTGHGTSQGRGSFSLLAPLTNPVAVVTSLTSLLVGRPVEDADDPFARRSTTPPDLRPKRTAASRTSSPAPTPHRQPVAEGLEQLPMRMTGARTVRPSGVEAASTARRAARRAATRAENRAEQ